MPIWPAAVVIVLLTFFAPRIMAADIFDLGDLHFETVGEKQTFEGGLVTATVQDNQGFMWFGSYSGLLRFDGYRFKQFSHDSNDEHSLGGNYIRTLALGPDGRVWVGTFADGISVYDPKTDKFQNYRHDPNNPDSLSNNRVDAITVAEDGTVWIGTNNGLDRLDVGSNQFRHYQKDPKEPSSLNDNHIRSLIIDAQNYLWIGSWNGVNRYVGQGKFDNPMLVNDDNGRTHLLKDHIISSMFEDTQGNKWFGSYSKGLVKLDKDGQITQVPLEPHQSNQSKKANIKAIVQINDQHIWLATYGRGVFELNIDNNEITGHFLNDPAKTNSIAHNQVSTLLKDHSGLLWVGTWGGGLNRVNASDNAFRTLYHTPNNPFGLSHQDIGPTLALDNGIIWVGTRGNGIDVLDPKIGLVNSFRPLPATTGALNDGSIKALAQSRDGTIWVGTISAGLFQYLGDHSFKRFDKSHGLSGNTVRYILPEGNDTLWIATGSGLNRLNRQSGEIERIHGESGQPVKAAFEILAMQRDGTLWASANNGLYMLPNGATHLLRLTHNPDDPQSISHNNTIGLLVDSEDTLWVATSSGINRLTKKDGKNSRFENINQFIGRGAGVLGENLQQDGKGRVWTGQMMIDPKTWQSVDLSEADGITNNGGWLGAYGKSKNGTLLYGGNNGLAMIKPEKFERWQYEPPLVISRLKVDGIEQPVPTELVLPPGTKTFSLEFSALDYSAPRTLQYRYRLAGFDSDWMDSSHEYRVANYTNLDPGNYQLMVKGSNRLGDWSSQILKINVVQLPAWYQTTFFKIAMIVVAVALLYLFFRARLRHLNLKQQKLQILVEERTEQLLEAKLSAESASLAKSNFLAAMSHEIRTPMNAVLGYAQLLQQDDTLGPNHKKTLHAIEKAGNHLIDVINDILDLSKIEAGNAEMHPRDFDLAELVRGLDTMLELRCKQKGIEWHLQSNLQNNCYVHGDAPKLRQILINLLGNAYKFTDHGSITLVAKALPDNKYRFEVIDSGPGMSEQEQKAVFEPFVQAQSGHAKGGTGLGLAISQSHIQIMDGHIGLNSTPGVGSKFTIELPLPVALGKVEKAAQQSNAVQVLRAEYTVRVMIIDSDTENRDILKRALVAAGIEVMTATHGEQALGPLSMLGKANAPQLIFMDMRMSHAEDVNAFEHLKAKTGDDIKLIAMTTSLVDGGPEHFSQMGFAQCIGKPYRFEEVYQCIAEQLDVIFEDESPRQASDDAVFDIRNAVIEQKLYQQLMDTAQTFEIASLESLVAEITEQQPDLKPLLNHLKRHIDSYDIDEFIEELETIKVEQDA